ncbi:hypothetical protein J7E90_16385 [Streptomyces sp. ISL-111]|uniref:hypothetical protein n=1 Tax=Streptomyces sp. ISL-111 TaxID=2819175 RepID=UPI001BE68872|nr:hypothetical protein [Streptomyces sp. ISL-111]MBT2378884.1 hypothetical protein [Streptomyces sp. ISL-111]
MEALREPLDEAFRSAPKFEAGVARSHGFGTRALEEFKDSKVWLKVDSNGSYDLNLAANEYMANGHTLDKHVGKRGGHVLELRRLLNRLPPVGARLLTRQFERMPPC